MRTWGLLGHRLVWRSLTDWREVASEKPTALQGSSVEGLHHHDPMAQEKPILWLLPTILEPSDWPGLFVLLMHQSWGSGDTGFCEFKVVSLHPSLRGARSGAFSQDLRLELKPLCCWVSFPARDTSRLQLDMWWTPPLISERGFR